MIPAALTVVLLLCTGGMLELATAACPVQYSTDPGPGYTPLLYGGYYSACKSGCKPRDSIWGASCKLDPQAYTAWGVCEDWQRPLAHQLGQLASSGAVDQLSPCDFFEALGNRTLWIIGDSHAKVLYYSLRCFMMDFWDHGLGECASSADAGTQKQLELASAQGHPYNNPPRCLHFTDTSARICMVHNPIGTYLVSDDTQSPGVLQLLNASFTAPDDVVYVAFGHWHANNCEGIHPSYAEALENFGAYAQAVRSSMPYIIFGVAPHEHTRCEGTTFDYSTATCLPPEQGNYDLGISQQRTQMAHAILNKYSIPIIDSYNISLALFNSHVTAEQSIAGVLDCLHYCRPSLAEIDIWKLFTYIAAQKRTQEAASKQQQQQHSCVAMDPPLLYKPHGPVDPSATQLHSRGELAGSLWQRYGWSTGTNW